MDIAAPTRLFQIITVIWFGIAVSGCSLMEIDQQTGAVDSAGAITGKIDIQSDQHGPVIVLRFTDDQGVAILTSRQTLSSSGTFKFNCPPGQFYIAAFIDQNGDGVYQSDEHGNYYGLPSKISVAQNDQIAIDSFTISGPIPPLQVDIKVVGEADIAIWNNIGAVTTLDNPRFAEDHYAQGLWRPLDFLREAEGGLFMLEPYQADKTPILLIHGVSNGPRLWRSLIESLDSERYQPWLLYYPSGVRLNMISDYLVEALTRLEQHHHFDQFAVIAHSMGGLVARSFVKKYVAFEPDNLNKISMFMTVNSPMAGMSAAGAGVRQSPIIVPSWRDVDPDGEFIQDLHEWNWPDGIPYHLIISYLDDNADDGVVPLASQAQPKLQTEASRIYLFQQEHSMIIDDDQFHIKVKEILSSLE